MFQNAGTIPTGAFSPTRLIGGPVAALAADLYNKSLPSPMVPNKDAFADANEFYDERSRRDRASMGAWWNNMFSSMGGLKDPAKVAEYAAKNAAYREMNGSYSDYQKRQQAATDKTMADKDYLAQLAALGYTEQDVMQSGYTAEEFLLKFNPDYNKVKSNTTRLNPSGLDLVGLGIDGITPNEVMRMQAANGQEPTGIWTEETYNEMMAVKKLQAKYKMEVMDGVTTDTLTTLIAEAGEKEAAAEEAKIVKEAEAEANKAKAEEKRIIADAERELIKKNKEAEKAAKKGDKPPAADPVTTTPAAATTVFAEAPDNVTRVFDARRKLAGLREERRMHNKDIRLGHRADRLEARVDRREDKAASRGYGATDEVVTSGQEILKRGGILYKR